MPGKVIVHKTDGSVLRFEEVADVYLTTTDHLPTRRTSDEHILFLNPDKIIGFEYVADDSRA
jgi:hypothetical protein